MYRRVQSWHVVIGSAQEFAEYANSVIDNITILYVPPEDMSSHLCDDPPKVAGTLQVRHIERVADERGMSLYFYTISPQSGDKIPPFRHVLYNSDGTGICSVLPTPTMDTSMNTVPSEDTALPNEQTLCIPGQWYAAYCQEYRYWFIGHALEVNEELNLIKLDFMEQKAIGTNKFVHNKDVDSVDIGAVFYKLTGGPVPVSTTRYDTFCISDADFRQIQDIFAQKYRNQKEV